MPAEQITNELSEQNYVSISKVIPMLRCFWLTIVSKSCVTSIGRDLRAALQSNFSKRFGSIEKEKVMAMATVLDPRYKKMHFENPIAFSEILRRLNNELSAANNEFETNRATPTTTESDTNNIWDIHDKMLNNCLSNIEDSIDGISCSIRQYLQLPMESRYADPIVYWEDNKKCYAKLHEIALKYLTTVATSVPSERLFSKAGDTVWQKRNRLDPKRLEKLVIMSNLSVDEWNNLKY